MKIEYIQDTIIIYIHTYDQNGMNFKNKEKVEQYFRELFLKLKKDYEIALSGFYHIKVYTDAYYGAILVLEKEEFEYYPSFDETLDMQIIIDDMKKILFKCEDCLDFLKKDCWIYEYQSLYYIELKSKEDTQFMGKLLEIATPIFGEDVEKVLRYGKKIK